MTPRGRRGGGAAPAGPDGLCVVDKPAGMTSHDVVARARRALGTRKVGHAGTLDPSATGVLLLGVGRATRLLRFLTALPKSYVGEVVLGVETTTLDADGDVIATHDMAAVTPADVAAAARDLEGDILQVPPMVSALKVGGRRLHELAREGVEVEREARPVTVHRLEVTPIDAGAGVYRIAATCSSGTYVRTLAADLGTALGGGAHLRHLRRTAVGSFTEADARGLDDLVLLELAEALRDLVPAPVDGAGRADVAHGRPLGRSAAGLVGDGPWAVLDAATGALLAVYEAAGSEARAAVVVAPAG